MNTEIRDKIEMILHANYLPGLADNKELAEILALFPQWRTFSPTCLPDKGKAHLFRTADKSIMKMCYWGEWTGWHAADASAMWDENDLIKNAYQFYEIPNE